MNGFCRIYFVRGGKKNKTRDSLTPSIKKDLTPLFFSSLFCLKGEKVLIESYIYKGGGDFINNNNNENSSVSIKSTEARERVKEIEGSLGFGLTMKKEVETMAETKKKGKVQPEKERWERSTCFECSNTPLYPVIHI